MKKIFVAIFSFAIFFVGENFSFANETDTAEKNSSAEIISSEKISSDSDRLLEAIGATTSASLYLGYLSLASIRDNVESQRYESAQVEQLIGSVVETISIVTDQLKNMRKYSRLSDADSSMISDMSEISALLADEAMWLKRYSATQSHTDMENFEEMQKKAWEKLKLLFGNDEEKQ